MEIINIKAEDVAMIIEGIMYGESEYFEEIVSNDFNELENFAEALRDSGKTFSITRFG